MLSGKTQASVQPYAYGSLLQAATYGATIPIIFGRTQSPLLAFWTANLRQGGSSKKGKAGKKGVTAYCENISFVGGHNPILGALQIWNNGTKAPLNFTTYSATLSGGSITVPDAHFYAVVGVTITSEYVALFHDYGASGLTVPDGVYEIPLWNELFVGPDPTHGSAARNYPYCYRWSPVYGATLYFDADVLAGATVTVHYAQLASSIGYQTPLAKNRLHFESVCGDGDEYTGNFQGGGGPLSAQQIEYPMFAGAGSASIDLGSAGVIPQMQVEWQGKFGVYPDGDADFADMIENVIKSGVAQANIGSSTTPQPSFTRLEHGLSCYRFPGAVQRKVVLSVASQQNVLQYNLSTTAGNFLLVLASNELASSATLSIADTASNTWTPIFSGGNCRQAWYAQAVGGDCEVTISGFNNNGTQVSIFEIAGLDSIDSVVVGSAGVGSVTTTNTRGWPAYVLGLGFWTAAAAPADPSIAHWNSLLDASTSMYGGSSQYHLVLERNISAPGDVGLALSGSPDDMCLIAFKASNPAANAKPVGDFLDLPSLDLVRRQCRANGLWGSLSMSSQQAASDWLKTLYQAANAAPVYTGFKLFSMPYSEASAAGNGAIYEAPSSGGPIFNLSTENGDFVTSGGEPPIRIKTASRVNEPNVLQMQCLSRSSDYNPSVVQQPDAGSIALYGLRKDDPVQNNAVQDVGIARSLLGIQVRRKQYGGDTFSFRLPAKWCLLAPMGAGGGGEGLGAGPTSPRSPGAGESILQIYISPDITGLGGPYFGPIWTGGKNLWLTAYIKAMTLTLGMTTGGVLVPNRIDAVYNFDGLALSVGSAMPGYGVVTALYPQWSASGPFGDGVGFIGGEHPYGTSLISGTSVANTNQLRVTAVYENTLPGSGSGGYAVEYVVLTVYYADPVSPGSISRVISGGGSAVADSVITITDPQADINQIPVRITKITENEDLTLDCEAEPFIYGMNAPLPLTTDVPAPFTPGTSGSAGSINAPVLFEPTPRLSGNATQDQLWAVISSSDPNFGGAQAYISTDGGSSYVPIGDPIVGSAVTGVSTADWPAASDPDTTNDLPLNLSESAGVLGSFSAGQRDAFQSPCYIAGGGAFAIPYELFTYNTATLTSANHYTLKATGSGNELRRGVYAAPSPAVGVDHPSGSRFAFLDPDGAGMVKIPVDPAWIGTTIYLKFPTFNTFGAGLQSLSSATAYPYTITGVPGGIGPGGGFLVNGI
jgi:hypothetical protein